MQETEIIECETKTVSCDGGNELGHPTIYLGLSKNEGAVCPYCSRHFVLKNKPSS